MRRDRLLVLAGRESRALFSLSTASRPRAQSTWWVQQSSATFRLFVSLRLNRPFFIFHSQRWGHFGMMKKAGPSLEIYFSMVSATNAFLKMRHSRQIAARNG